MSNLVIQTNDSTHSNIHILAGIIRKTSQGWELLNNATHRPVGLNPTITEPSNNTIEVKFDRKYSQVLTCSITADEAYAEKGFMFGASVGLDKLVIKHSKAGAPTKNSDLAIPNSNIWISVMMIE
ncbi:MAG TPA: hypothetical protein PKA54_06565 [Chitinophagaceae bacterium]|nr:MAG: hypothetical protein UZ11_BCD004000081 [Bacteroidetes bacterium OLB11]HMN33017.1 hypothetical protein [Chitinophagaceae bacterium]